MQVRQSRKCWGFGTVAKSLALAAAMSASVTATSAQAQSTEERFQDLFVTAGYCTAFGAALGTALLAWTENPAENLRYVAVGASLGFIGGSILGTYVIFTPMVSDSSMDGGSTLLSGQSLPERRLALRPVWNRDTHRIDAVEGGMTLATF